MLRLVILRSVDGFRRRRGRLFRVKVRGLQGRRRGLTSLLGRFLLAHTIAHPFTHVQACNTDDGGGAIGVEPCMPVASNDEVFNHREARVTGKHWDAYCQVNFNLRWGNYGESDS